VHPPLSTDLCLSGPLFSLWSEGIGCSGCGRGALNVQRLLVYCACNVRKLSAAGLAVVHKTACEVHGAACTALLVVKKRAWAVVRLSHRGMECLLLSMRRLQRGVVMVGGAGKQALVHTYRSPGYMVCAYRGSVSALQTCGSSVKKAATTDYVALLRDVGHQQELQSQESLPIFVFAAHVLLRVGNEGPLPPLRQGYMHVVKWADKLVEAVLPVSGRSPAPSERVPASTGRVLLKTVSRTTLLVGRTAAASPGAACRMAGGLAGAGVRRVLSFTPARTMPASSTTPAKDESSTNLLLPGHQKQDAGAEEQELHYLKESVALLGLVRGDSTDSGADVAQASKITTVENGGGAAEEGGERLKADGRCFDSGGVVDVAHPAGGPKKKKKGNKNKTARAVRDHQSLGPSSPKGPEARVGVSL
jgi:hypothetical protein